ncbi:MAG: hypothetical protein ACK40G_17810 [Cytophagaceae bacterium]
MLSLYKILIIVLLCNIGFPLQSQNVIEILDSDKVKVNNIIPFKTTVKNIKNILGKADSVVKVTNDCPGYFNFEKVSLHYYGNSVFESLKDTIVIQKIVFKDKIFSLNSPYITFNSQTTLEELKNILPVSINESFLFNDPVTKLEYRLVRIAPKTNFDDRWILKFLEGYLVEIEYWVPC